MAGIGLRRLFAYTITENGANQSERQADFDKRTAEFGVYRKVVMIEIDSIVPVAPGKEQGADGIPA